MSRPSGIKDNSIPGTHNDFPEPAHVLTQDEAAAQHEQLQRARAYVRRHALGNAAQLIELLNVLPDSPERGLTSTYVLALAQRDAEHLIEMLGITGEQREIKTSYSVRVAEQRARRRQRRAQAHQHTTITAHERDDHDNVGTIDDSGIRRTG